MFIQWNYFSEFGIYETKMRSVKNLGDILAEGRISFAGQRWRSWLKGRSMAATEHTVYMNARTRVSSFTLPRSRTYGLLIRVWRIRRPCRAHNLARASERGRAGCHFNCPMIGAAEYRSACPSISRAVGLPEISPLSIHRTRESRLIL